MARLLVTEAVRDGFIDPRITRQVRPPTISPDLPPSTAFSHPLDHTPKGLPPSPPPSQVRINALIYNPGLPMLSTLRIEASLSATGVMVCKSRTYR